MVSGGSLGNLSDSVRMSYTYSDVVHIDCYVGYYIANVTNITCNEIGSWNGSTECLGEPDNVTSSKVDQPNLIHHLVITNP